MTSPHNGNKRRTHEPGNRLTPHLDEDAKPAEIKEDIARTRAAMDRTLDELGERLRPRHWLSEAISALRGTGEAAGEMGEVGLDRARRMGEDAARVVRRHPVPTALVIGGLAWLAIEQVSGRSITPRSREDREFDRFERQRRRAGYGTEGENLDAGFPPVIAPRARGSVTGPPLPRSSGAFHRHGDTVGGKLREGAQSSADRTADAGERAADTMHRTKERLTSARRDFEDRAGNAARHLRESATAAGDRLSHVAHSAADRIRATRRGLGRAASDAADRVSSMTSDAAGRVSHTASHAADRLSEGARIAQERGKETVDQHPLAVAAAMFGLGLLVGVAVPSSRQEDELFGEESDQAKRAARRAGEEALERGKEVASASAAAARDEARKQGLTPSSLIERGEKVAATAAQEAERAAEREGLTPHKGHQGSEAAGSAPAPGQ